ncbi:MAG: hypothetical protein GVY18_17690 [Bacteroidetes bacterium]|jgi:UDP-N-acetylglucosamine diphosphorylase/glucosamine-1-phosphate N-acetyltransferase|nr:hypothetical protein [Bacteroidota bacterium]
MHLCLFEDDGADHLLPLTATRAVYDLRIGRRTLLTTTRDAFGRPPTLLHARPLVAQLTAQENDLLVNRIPEGLDVLFVNGRYVAEAGDVLDRLRHAIRTDGEERVFVQDDTVIAAWVPNASSRFVQAATVTHATFEGMPEETVEGATLIGRLWHLIDALRPALVRDFAAAVSHEVYERPGATVHPSAVLVEGEHIMVAPDATVQAGAVLDASGGPIHIDEGATVMAQAVVRGPAYIGPKAQVKVGADVEGSAIGVWSKVGGEVHDSVLHSLSNKAHAGFLGHSYLGRWCNLGADTNVSNLRNDYGEVTLYDAVTGTFASTGRQFLGLVMGDHSKCGIDTMVNTGTVVGVSCSLFGAGYLPRHVPSFSWGGPDRLMTYRLDKALQVADAVMRRRDRHLTDADRENLEAVFEGSGKDTGDSGKGG